MRRAAVALALAALAAACAPAAEPPLAAPVPARIEPTLKVITPTAPDPGILDDGCAPGNRPEFAYGFGALKDVVGDRMGDPASCERYGPEGDALQQTTTGLARYRKASNTPTFTSGSEHWALTERGVVHWTGGGLDPPADASDAATPTAPPLAATPAPAIGTPAGDAEPTWLGKALLLIAEYDRTHGTVLVPALAQVRIVVFRHPGAWAAFIPSARTITLDPVLETEEAHATATVLAHEAQHTVDQVLNGGARTTVACYSYEISAFRLQAAMWQNFYGPAGKPDPSTDLELELNDILVAARTDAGRLITGIHKSYADQCA
jgi:hypothetical protein